MKTGDVLLDPGYRDTDLVGLSGKVVATVDNDEHRVRVVFTDGTETDRRMIYGIDRPHGPAGLAQRDRYQQAKKDYLPQYQGPSADSKGRFVEHPETGEKIYEP